MACERGAGKASSLLRHFAVSLETDGSKLQVKLHKLKVALPASVLHWQGSPPGISALENKQGDGLSSQVEQDPARPAGICSTLSFDPATSSYRSAMLGSCLAFSHG